jgi:hypothetical protein
MEEHEHDHDHPIERYVFLGTLVFFPRARTLLWLLILGFVGLGLILVAVVPPGPNALLPALACFAVSGLGFVIWVKVRILAWIYGVKE